MKKKILIMGLPGSGKTTLSAELAPLINAVHFNADEVRKHISHDLGFSHNDRIEHAKRMGWMSDQVVNGGATVIADFICPTKETRKAFGPAFVVWVDRIEKGRFEDTNHLFEPPETFDVRVDGSGSPRFWAEKILAKLRPVFNPKRPTALFLGRYQPFHNGHLALIEEGLQRVGQCCIAVRDTYETNDKNPMSFFEVKQRIDTMMAAHIGRYEVISVPNITNIFYGRDVGYDIQEIELNQELQSISATAIRDKINELP